MAKLAAGVRIEGEDLSNADWTEADAADAVFIACTIEGASLASTVLVGAKFERCRLARSRFSHADLRDATFDDCRFADPQ
ncbi:MAG TPA: pentapeptide repeat-containing protein, partial [Caulobacteraceae bacterium]|nr:pentapeptide repeat-containing protein [Caulobacteraceae bacterium]